jgi:hypothetical protein
MRQDSAPGRQDAECTRRLRRAATDDSDSRQDRYKCSLPDERVSAEPAPSRSAPAPALSLLQKRAGTRLGLLNAIVSRALDLAGCRAGETG